MAGSLVAEDVAPFPQNVIRRSTWRAMVSTRHRVLVVATHIIFLASNLYLVVVRNKEGSVAIGRIAYSTDRR